MRFSKGHGTQNDFVVLPDPDGALDLTAARVAALCDRRQGLGADGVLRVVRWKAIPADDTGVGEPEPGVEWFMDYRNGDGSIAEMCGNGVRVFARYLAATGLAAEPEFTIGTRGGLRTVAFAGGDTRHGDVAVGMGPAVVGPASTAVVDGREYPGVAVDIGNPHLVCITDEPIDALDLARPPAHDPALFPHGVNVEFVSPLHDDAITMRVHERGVGETRSCGTGTVAAVAASLHRAGRAEGTVAVTTPGGPLRVTVTPDGTTLSGPAVLVAEGELSDAWWSAH
ncbi:diaminopimelate epimerase [Pseudonocardia sp. CA-107938]|uniref:diaminopimelate epimerase n=1 Tax=Pseudonocardia sp. CA-107938 TaxID=3240021 RepID=UPI003D8E5AD6